jgi:hypothetical protein
MYGAVPLFFRMPTWCVDIWPLPLPSWVAVMMHKGLQRECAWNALRNYHVIWLENQANKLRRACLLDSFWTMDLIKTTRGWHRVDRNERWTVLQNICWDMQFCLVSWDVCWWTLYLWTVKQNVGVCFANGLDLISIKLFVTLREKMKLCSEFSVNVLMRQRLWHARHMIRPTL